MWRKDVAVTHFFVFQHPGGEEIILECAGSEATGAFWDKGHSSHAHIMLQNYYIGELREVRIIQPLAESAKLVLK